MTSRSALQQIQHIWCQLHSPLSFIHRKCRYCDEGTAHGHTHRVQGKCFHKIRATYGKTYIFLYQNCTSRLHNMVRKKANCEINWTQPWNSNCMHSETTAYRPWLIFLKKGLAILGRGALETVYRRKSRPYIADSYIWLPRTCLLTSSKLSCVICNTYRCNRFSTFSSAHLQRQTCRARLLGRLPWRRLPW